MEISSSGKVGPKSQNCQLKLKFGNQTNLNMQNFMVELFCCCCCCFFFYPEFLSQPLMNHRTAGEGEGRFFNLSLPLPPALETLRHQPENYCRELTSAHRQQPESNREPLVSQRKSLTTKLSALFFNFRSEILFLSKFGGKNKNSYFEKKFCNQTNSNIQN